MAKQQPPALATYSRKHCSLTTVRKGQSQQTNSNGIDLENIKRVLCVTAADSIKQTKEVATCHATKAANKIEETVTSSDLNNTKKTNDNKEINTKMADDTETMLSLCSADQNNDDKWMDTGDNNIGGTIQTLDYVDETNEKIPSPSATK
eukprot:5985382-Ditylum_brightwellii.AAC.1